MYLLGSIVAGLGPREEREGLREPLLIRERRRGDDHRLGFRLVRDALDAEDLLRERHRLLRPAEAPEAVRDQVVLVGPTADPLVRLQLRDGLLPPAEPVERQAEHLPNGAGSRGEAPSPSPLPRPRPWGRRGRAARSRGRGETSHRVPCPAGRSAGSRPGSPAAERRSARRLESHHALWDGRNRTCRKPTETRTGRPRGRPVRTKSRQRPTLPLRLQSSTIGAGGLNFRVRDGTGCSPSAMATETACLDRRFVARSRRKRGCAPSRARNTIASASKSQVLGLLVRVSSTRCRASTSRLSTSWSARGLTWSSQWEISSRGRLRT